MGERIDINGHPTWVDDRGGNGDETVLLLHGTAYIGGPFHYDDMATDTIAVLEQSSALRHTSSDGVTAGSSGCSSRCAARTWSAASSPSAPTSTMTG